MNSSHNNTSLQVYHNTQIAFQLGKDLMVNLTDIAKAFPKKNLTNILNSQEIKEYCEAISKLQNYSLADLVIVAKGGNNPGTWAHQKVALRVAQKLSPEFAVWVDSKLEELLTAGVAVVDNNDDEVIAQAMAVLQRRLDASTQRAQMLQSTVQVQEQELKTLAPKATYTDQVLQSTTTYTLTQVAHDLGMRSVFALTAWLKAKGVLFHQSKQWQPTAKVAGKHYFATRTAKYIKDGEIHTSLSTVVTETGRAWMHTMLQNERKVQSEM